MYGETSAKGKEVGGGREGGGAEGDVVEIGEGVKEAGGSLGVLKLRTANY